MNLWVLQCQCVVKVGRRNKILTAVKKMCETNEHPVADADGNMHENLFPIGS